MHKYKIHLYLPEICKPTQSPPPSPSYSTPFLPNLRQRHPQVVDSIMVALPPLNRRRQQPASMKMSTYLALV
ncbi:hypothetical protein RHMOL_Rhmol03G0120100 [Rhododendron molle]|uniref:Uncharacterized protein n=1 Tax=Rhododendron molle TaxID=49168 RepID=A0ACC0PDK4_RHOML|nr:hypothetical protein RHMOL_Rhmol03G0120100 [Rhododendron molle]